MVEVEIAVPTRIGSQRELAAFLHSYFRTKIVIVITDTTIASWRKGERLRSVLVDGKWVRPPPFPNKNGVGSFWKVHECIEWVEKWIVPVHAASTEQNGMPLDDQKDLETIEREHKIWKLGRERQIAEGEYKSAEGFRQDLIAIGQKINAAINESCEVILKSTMEKALDNPDDAMKLKILEAAKAAADALREKIKQALVSVP
jgi:hypothetical protein